MASRQIVALGGGGFSDEPGNTLLDDYILSLTGVSKPRVCFLPTASGDAEGYIEKFYTAFAPERCVPSHFTTFRPRQLDRRPELAVDLSGVRPHLLAQDVIYVGGGNLPSMLAAWRLHEVDLVLREAWDRGIVLCGISAGALCWFEAGTTNSFGRGIEPLLDGLGFLPGSHCPHYDSEPNRRPKFQEWIATGVLPPGYAADDCAALHFVEQRHVRVVASKPGARCYSVIRTHDGATEIPLETELLQ